MQNNSQSVLVREKPVVPKLWITQPEKHVFVRGRNRFGFERSQLSLFQANGFIKHRVTRMRHQTFDLCLEYTHLRVLDLFLSSNASHCF